MQSPKYSVDQSLVNIGSNPLKVKRAQSHMEPSKFNSGKPLVQVLSESQSIQLVTTHEDLFQLEESDTVLIPMDILLDLLKSYEFNNDEIQRQAKVLKELEQKRLLLKFQSAVNFKSFQQ